MADWGGVDQLPEVIEAQAPSLHPEGIAYDSGRDAFLVSSVGNGTVAIVEDDGEVSTLVDDPNLISTPGVLVDASRGRVLVANADAGVAPGSTPDTAFDLAGLGIYDLNSGELIEYVDLGALTPEVPAHLANDIAVGWDGTAYVTDSLAGIVYEVALDGTAKVLVQDERLLPKTGGLGANGIVYRPGRLIVVNYDDGSLYRIDLDRPENMREIEVDGDLTGADGLILSQGGSLIAVTNSLGGGGEDTVKRLRMTRSETEARIVDDRSWPDAWPTAATQVGNSTYVLSGNLGVLLLGEGTSDEFTIRRF